MKRIIILLSVFIIFISCSSRESSLPESRFMLGTVVSIQIFDKKSDTLLNSAYNIIDSIEKKMSVKIEGSDIYKINKNSGKNAVTVSNETLDVIKKGIYYGDLSKGKFDISIGPLVNLWNIGSGGEKVPEIEKIELAASRVDYTKIRIDDREVFIDQNMALDLGGIAKGYTADKIAEYLVENGIKSAIINLGGNLKIIGTKENNQPFNVGIQNPFSTRYAYLGIVKVRDSSVVSSGDYERFFEVDGVRYHHIFDKTTGFPVNNHVSSVTVITKSSMDADALSTTFFSLGVDEGFKLAKKLQNILLVYVTKDNIVHISEELEGNFELTDNSFNLMNSKGEVLQ